jgi:NAD(P)-dependent dehydrogenase (short-subunit alcohol dehydrogenase family)
MIYDLSGRIALVTGAGQGVGAGIASMLAARGAAVAVNDVRAQRAEETVASITAAGGKAMPFAFDVTDYEAVASGIADVAQSLGPVDVLVNNAGNGGAGGMRPRPFRETDPSEWEGPVRVNLYGVLHCSRAVINGMCDRRWGRVITIASGAGMVGLDIGVAAYGAGKGGAIGFVRHLAIENASFGVTANTIALGLMQMEQPADITARMARSIPVGRLGRPDDAGALCVYLASEEAAWMTGQTIHLNGGSVTG